MEDGVPSLQSIVQRNLNESLFKNIAAEIGLVEPHRLSFEVEDLLDFLETITGKQWLFDRRGNIPRLYCYNTFEDLDRFVRKIVMNLQFSSWDAWKLCKSFPITSKRNGEKLIERYKRTPSIVTCYGDSL